jgi:hypothetical protein
VENSFLKLKIKENKFNKLIIGEKYVDKKNKN